MAVTGKLRVSVYKSVALRPRARQRVDAPCRGSDVPWVSDVDDAITHAHVT